MTFKIDLLPEIRKTHYFAPDGCTEMELKYLEYVSYLSGSHFTPIVTTSTLPVNNRMAKITTIQKPRSFGSQTHLIVDSNNNHLPGMVVQDLERIDDQNRIRYFNGLVYFNPEEETELATLLTNIGYVFPDTALMALSHLVDLLHTLGVPVSQHFTLNTIESGNWIAKKIPKFAKTPWPTTLDQR